MHHQDRRSGLSGRRFEDQEECPLTPECVRGLIRRLESVESKVDAIPDMQKKVNDLHEKWIWAGGRAGGLMQGIKIGFVMSVIGIFTFFTFLVGLLSGRISIKDLFSGFF